jgi:predicted signal transduction protein with EAL and GGDEF domain
VDSEFVIVVAIVVKAVVEGTMIGFFVAAEEEKLVNCMVKFAFWLLVSYHFFPLNYEHIAVDPLQTIYPQHQPFDVP